MPETTFRADARKTLVGLQAQSPKGNVKVRLNVGYSAPYAARIHEDLSMVHPNGQAKYLEQPARQYQKEIDQAIANALKNKRSLKDALTAGAQVLLKHSLPLVPVDTGRLKDSHFIEVG